jgi:hypothetical protein
MCDIHIKGLPCVLTGRIIPDLSIASLFGIRVLTKAGCEVTFTCNKCIVCYKNNIILQGEKDPATNLWTLPLGSPGMTSQNAKRVLPLAAPVVADAHAHSAMQIAFFTHTMRNKANSIHFAHQVNPCVARAFPPFSKLSNVGTSKGARISRPRESQNISTQVQQLQKDI